MLALEHISFFISIVINGIHEEAILVFEVINVKDPQVALAYNNPQSHIII